MQKKKISGENMRLYSREAGKRCINRYIQAQIMGMGRPGLKVRGGESGTALLALLSSSYSFPINLHLGHTNCQVLDTDGYVKLKIPWLKDIENMFNYFSKCVKQIGPFFNPFKVELLIYQSTLFKGM